MAISSDGHRELFPFLSDRVRKKRKKIETCQSASYFETREKTREGNKVSIQLNQVITKHLSDLVHVTTTESLSFSSLFCYPRVRRHVNEPKCKTVELKKLNKQKLAVWAGRVILFFILINLFFLFFFFFSVLFISFGHVTDRFPSVYSVFLLRHSRVCFCDGRYVMQREDFFTKN